VFNVCIGWVEIESEWTDETRTTGRKTLSGSRTAPLKPKSGLSGPPVVSQPLLAVTSRKTQNTGGQPALPPGR